MRDSGNMFQPVKKTRVYEEIVTKIKDMLDKGRLKSGDQLPGERELSGVFQVSRSSVREALRTLTSRGLLETVPGKGVSIRRVSSEDIKEIYPILANLEGLAASMAVDQITGETLAELLKDGKSDSPFPEKTLC